MQYGLHSALLCTATIGIRVHTIGIRVSTAPTVQFAAVYQHNSSAIEVSTLTCFLASSSAVGYAVPSVVHRPRSVAPIGVVGPRLPSVVRASDNPRASRASTPVGSLVIVNILSKYSHRTRQLIL